MRDPFDIWPETSPADALDALATIAGEDGAPRAINDLNFLGDKPFFGRAVTLRSLPARPDHDAMVNERERAAHGIGPFPRAMSLCDERSVLVIAAHDTQFYAAAGGTGLSSLIGRKAAALLTDGQIRDSIALAAHAKKSGTALVTGGFTPHYGTVRMLTPAEVNVPVSIRGRLIVPGDYLFGDRDGVVIIPEQLAEEVLETAVVLARSAQVMEELLIARRGIIGIDVSGVAGEVEEMMFERFDFSERQIELLHKNVTRVR